MGIIYLIGARASGKTTVGKALATLLGWQFTDLDHMIVDLHGESIAQIVENRGWPEFRKRESVCLKKAGLTEAPTVISTGGGIILSPENRARLAASPGVAWLKADPETLEARLAKNPQATQRPSLTGLGILEELRQVIKEREPLYAECASHVFDASLPVPLLCQEIAAKMAPDQIINMNQQIF